MHHGPLDMRMDREQAFSAYDLVNSYSYGDLKRLIANLGGEKKAAKIAAAIVRSREEAEIKTTEELVDIIVRAVGRYNDTIHPATRTFQAIRIQVNDELGQLKHGLELARNLLKDDGRIVVVTFHSLEDKIVKDYFKGIAGIKEHSNRHMPDFAFTSTQPEFSPLTKKAVLPSDEEVAANPRARSAKLRAVEKVR
jgi:16S rRNA (cytosine1402-N4)-methyltransferase